MNFRDMTPEERKAIAKKGGKAAVRRHRFTSEEAKAAGRKGGRTKTRAELSALGKKGGQAKRTKKERGTTP